MNDIRKVSTADDVGGGGDKLATAARQVLSNTAKFGTFNSTKLNEALKQLDQAVKERENKIQK